MEIAKAASRVREYCRVLLRRKPGARSMGQLNHSGLSSARIPIMRVGREDLVADLVEYLQLARADVPPNGILKSARWRGRLASFGPGRHQYSKLHQPGKGMSSHYYPSTVPALGQVLCGALDCIYPDERARGESSVLAVSAE